MNTFTIDLFNYNQKANQDIIAVLHANEEKLTDRCVELISHILNVHQLWNMRINPTEAPYESWQIQPLHTLADVGRSNTETSLSIIKNFDANYRVEYQTRSGSTFSNSTQEILFQTITHSAYHRGQLATELRNCGIEPPLTDYIYYKMQQAESNI